MLCTLAAIGAFHQGGALAPSPARHATPHCSMMRQPSASTKEWLAQLLVRSREVPCPFFRRRAGDAIEAALGVLEFVAARHKSLDILPHRPMGSKRHGATLEDVMAVVREDIEQRRYYISGRLTQAVYSDRCFFDGPDPDMPVRSLQRYSDALRGLFDPATSRYELLRLTPTGPRTFTASWRLEGALRLPGRPRIKPYLGTTLYELDEDGLVCAHTETWSISALDAFVSVVFPEFGAAPAPLAVELLQDPQLWAHHVPAAPLPIRVAVE